MSSERTLPGSLALSGGAPFADVDWHLWMNANLLKLSSLIALRVISRVTSLPVSPTNGDIYIVPVGDTNEKQVAVRDDGGWVYYVPFTGLQAYDLDAGELVEFDGTNWAVVTSGGGATAFTGLTDVPSAYTSQAGKLVAVKGDESGLEFISAPGASSAFASINAQTGTTYTPVLGDAANVLVTLSNAAAITLTLPQDSDVAIPVNTILTFAQIGAGLVTVAAGAGATVNSRGAALDSAGQYAVITAIKSAANTWLLTGDLA